MPLTLYDPEPAPYVESQSLLDFLHDLSQPVTSLQCSSEVTLLKPRTVGEYVCAIEEHQALATDLNGMVRRFRDTFVDSKTEKGTASLKEAVVKAVETVARLAECVGAELRYRVEDVRVAGNDTRLRTGVAELLSAFLTARRQVAIRICEGPRILGKLQILVTDPDEEFARLTHPLPLVAKQKLVAAGVEVTNQPACGGEYVELRFSSDRHVSPQTSAIM